METWLLEDYAEGLLDSAETVLLEAHLAECGACRRELSRIKLLFWELESIRREPVPVPEALARKEAEVLDVWLAGREPAWRTSTRWVAAAAKRLGDALDAIPEVPGAAKLAASAGAIGVKTAKFVGKTAFSLIRDRLRVAGGGGG